jgi:hypothetical protein
MRSGTGDVALDWDRYERADFSRYVVVRLQGDRSVIVAEPTEATSTAFVDHPPDGRVGYQVLAVDAGGRTVGSSPVVAP